MSTAVTFHSHYSEWNTHISIFRCSSDCNPFLLISLFDLKGRGDPTPHLSPTGYFSGMITIHLIATHSHSFNFQYSFNLAGSHPLL